MPTLYFIIPFVEAFSLTGALLWNSCSGIKLGFFILSIPEYLCHESFGITSWIVKRPMSGQVHRASATETIDSGSIPGRVKPKTIKLVFTSSLLDVQQSKGQCEASTMCGREVED